MPLRNYLNEHPLVWIVPVVVVFAVVVIVAYLAWGEATTPESPFIYDI